MLLERYPDARELRFDLIAIDGLRIRHLRDALS